MRRKVRESQPVSYWKSVVDVITALLMVILLILMFFVLNFLVNKDVNPYPDNDYHGYYNDDNGYSYNDHEGDSEPSVTPTPTPTPTVTVTPADGGGRDGVDDPGIFDKEGTEGDGKDKAAVYVVLVDSETGKRIEAEHVKFDLFEIDGKKQTLATHYPEYITYTEFETTADGSFYLPEKILKGEYYFHQISEIEGYGITSKTNFLVENVHEWTNPLVVKIPLGPEKNSIQVQINDYVTGEGLPDVVFDVVANGDIVTADGTIRYRNGDSVTTFVCDESGYGYSEEIYVGNYVLVPTKLPFGMAAPELPTREIELKSKLNNEEHAPLVTLESKETTINVNSVDEAYNGIKLGGIVYTITNASDSADTRTFETNENGELKITQFKKDTTYLLEAKEVPKGYESMNDTCEIKVDKLGLIEMKPEQDIIQNYRIIRAEISTVDRVLRSPLKGYKITLTDEYGNEVKSWVSDGTPYQLDGLEPGVYNLKVDKSDETFTIKIEDTKDIQKYAVGYVTSRSRLVLAILGLLIGLAIFVILYVVINKHNKSKKNDMNDRANAIAYMKKKREQKDNRENN